MTFAPKIICVLSCGLLLCLGVSLAAKAHNDEAVTAGVAGHFARGHGGEEPAAKQRNEMERGQHKGGKTIKGEMLRVEDTTYFVQGPEEKEGRLRIDDTTPRARNIEPGHRNEPKRSELRAAERTAKMK